MVVFKCKIIIPEKEYNEELLKFNTIELLQNKILKIYNLTMYNYSVYEVRHIIEKDVNERKKLTTVTHIFNCVLHIFD